MADDKRVPKRRLKPISVAGSLSNDRDYFSLVSRLRVLGAFKKQGLAKAAFSVLRKSKDGL